MTLHRSILACLLAASICTAATPQNKKGEAPDFMNQPESWFASEEGIQQMRMLESWQLANGAWPKGYDPAKLNTDAKKSDVASFDNKSTTTEMKQMAIAFRASGKQEFAEAFNKGLDFIFLSQYPTGGWPQRYPPDQKNYGHYITFNDNNIVNVMNLLLDVQTKPEYAFVDEVRRSKAKAVFDLGIRCIVKSQITVNGTLTGWPQQCDEKTFAPTKARAFELPCISGGESSAILVFLMRIDNPGPEVVKAVHAGAAWFEKSKITGKKLEKRDGDVFVVDDASAETLWARCYEIETNRPIFVGRDSVKHYDLSEIEKERRTGYAWLRPFWGADVAKAYANWAPKHPIN